MNEIQHQLKKISNNEKGFLELVGKIDVQGARENPLESNTKSFRDFDKAIAVHKAFTSCKNCLTSRRELLLSALASLQTLQQQQQQQQINNETIKDPLYNFESQKKRESVSVSGMEEEASSTSSPITPSAKRRRKTSNTATESPIKAKGRQIYRIPNGNLVAAKVSKEKNEWILSTVCHYFSGQFKYEVEDVEDEGTAKQRYVLPSDCVIRIPATDEEAMQSEFPEGKQVLALFPQTTCLYGAKVAVPPSKMRRDGSEYLLNFDDDEDARRPVPARFVLEIPDPSPIL